MKKGFRDGGGPGGIEKGFRNGGGGKGRCWFLGSMLNSEN